MMPVNRDESGRRYVEAEVDVPGTPEDVWEAIATGRGISSWFVPTEVEEHIGGAITASFGPGMDSLSTITAWDPPRRFAADSRDETGPGGPTIATEWIVEARSGGTCVVRVVQGIGLARAAVGQRLSTAAGAPPFAGVAEWVGPPEWPEMLLVRLDEPAPGIAHLFALSMGGQVYLTIRFYLFGDQAAEAVAQAEPVWQAWIERHFGLAGPESNVA
jgi:uncharacterized protein YndB with AHSA1/START domain